MFSSPISSPVNVIGQTDLEVAQDAELCDNGVDDDADGAVDRQDEDCSPQAEEKQRQTAGAGEEEQTAEEICDNGVDDNGNGLIDNVDGLCSALVGQVQPVKSENPLTLKPPEERVKPVMVAVPPTPKLPDTVNPEAYPLPKTDVPVTFKAEVLIKEVTVNEVPIPTLPITCRGKLGLEVPIPTLPLTDKPNASEMYPV